MDSKWQDRALGNRRGRSQQKIKETTEEKGAPRDTHSYPQLVPSPISQEQEPGVFVIWGCSKQYRRFWYGNLGAGKGLCKYLYPREPNDGPIFNVAPKGQFSSSRLFIKRLLIDIWDISCCISSYGSSRPQILGDEFFGFWSTVIDFSWLVETIRDWGRISHELANSYLLQWGRAPHKIFQSLLSWAYPQVWSISLDLLAGWRIHYPRQEDIAAFKEL